MTDKLSLWRTKYWIQSIKLSSFANSAKRSRSGVQAKINSVVLFIPLVSQSVSDCHSRLTDGRGQTLTTLTSGQGDQGDHPDLDSFAVSVFVVDVELTNTETSAATPPTVMQIFQRASDQ